MLKLPKPPAVSAALRSLLGRRLEDLVTEGRAILVAEGLGWGEGPAYWPCQDAWIFSDIPNDRMLRWRAAEGLSVFRAPSRFANGNSVARDGALLTCEHGARRVSRTDPDGSYQVLCDRFEGGRLNSPNDLIEAADGTIWFSDPTYGIVSDVEGHRAPSEQSANGVYRLDLVHGVLTREIETLAMPNGLCFSPDGSRLYVADSGADMGPETPFNPHGPRHVWVFPVSNGRAVGRGQILLRVDDGVPDGLRCDEEGVLWVSTGAGLAGYLPDGRFLGAIHTPEVLANLAFGGADAPEVLLTLATSVYLVRLT